ncbi:two-component sensor histidine kinase [Sporosarcina sp. NCCP-2222]|uniref:sensor histidine kinase n=1 Tax=Sporosarcina sp. NCCP-2222 TaxID=2935073 RepID=UPI0020811074|nr:HAMP domain-containing sensor histidine kinase [Sporosarcina sp. NCCP-2222]GKV56357.1 two-component sensor histidine kinase [Sporosarcina sp. NCCP-2222]
MKSLYGRFLSFTVGIMMTSALVAFLVVNTYYHQQLKGKNDAKNMNIAEQIASFIENDEELDLNLYLQTQAAIGYKLYVVNEDREAVLYGAPFRKMDLSAATLDEVLAGDSYHGMRDLKTETFMTGFFSDQLANTVGVPFAHGGKNYALFMRPDIKFLFTEVHYLLGGMVIVMAIFSLLSMLIVAKKLIEPITKLTAATKKVAQERFDEPIDIQRRDEIGQLASSFQKMVDRLQQSDRMRKQFISDVSHDFQSPLLNIKGYATLLLDPAVREEERTNYVSIINSETDRLSTLTKQLLLLTSLDQLESPLRYKRFRLDEQLKDIVRKYRWALEDKVLSLSMDIEKIEVEGDPAFLEKVWENLLSNAVKYTEEGGEIEVAAVNEEDCAIVTVRDTGIGIPASHLDKLYERFYRVDDSRTRNIEGTGLGLSIVQQVVTLHKGTIEVASVEGEGTTFTITIPKL